MWVRANEATISISIYKERNETIHDNLSNVLYIYVLYDMEN